MRTSEQLVSNCISLIDAYQTGALGKTDLPEDLAPNFRKNERQLQLTYFTLPMAVNYRRNSTHLWQAAMESYNDPATKKIFDIEAVTQLDLGDLQRSLTAHKVAMQPNRHTQIWKTIATTVMENWGSLESMLESSGYDYLALKSMIQGRYRKGFPYLSGPKLFNYWCYILGEKCDIELKNKDLIDIAVDSHILKCSIKLGVISAGESQSLTREEVAARWREKLEGSGIAPTDLNVPLWFWSRNGFIYELQDDASKEMQ